MESEKNCFRHVLRILKNKTSCLLYTSSLDSLIGKIDSDYQETALDRELFTQIQKMDPDSKEKLLKTLKIWGNE